MTPGRVAEAMAAAGTASLRNVVMHLDWNQASIDSNRVCRDGAEPGDYVQWDPRELGYLNDWNVIYVPDGFDFQQIIAAQRHAASLNNGQPTIIVYRTVKGWKYGVEGRASHGAGHKLCSPGFYDALGPLATKVELTLPHCDDGESRCAMGCDATTLEDCFWEALSLVRMALVDSSPTVNYLADRLREAKVRLEGHSRQPRGDAPRIAAVYEAVTGAAGTIPDELRLEPGGTSTLRGELGRVLSYLNRASGGAVLAAAADLLGSTSVDKINAGFPEGYFKLGTNPGSRLLSIGGICEDAISGVLAGMSTFGHQIGVGSSYGAFMAPLGHISARLHAIGNQARQAAFGDPFNPFVLVCAHAGLKTGEDGPTHADPQALQLLQENFPKGTMYTLTPWDPQELWPLMAAALERRPAVVAPFVTRPNEPILDRAALGLPPATAAAQGVYTLRQAKGAPDAVVVIQGSGVAYAFIQEALPLLDEAGVDVTAYYIASAELFDTLGPDERERIFPEEHARIAMGITGFTLPTMYRWITSKRGREATQHPFLKGHFLGSGQAPKVLAEAGLDGRGQFEAIMKYRSAVAVS
jgi:transketolase